ncbi:MAG: DegQ family serine endoprotease [Rhodospirillaceae bacterium]|nr:DegQ family serine endoprotease [Rhodospirillaceae bacterium]
MQNLAALALTGLLALAPAAKAAEAVVPTSRQQVALTFAPVVKRASPAVVNVYTKRVLKQQASPLFNDPFFRQFFGEQFAGPRERVESSLGSGVIVRGNGVVITNNHVVGEADEITVILNDRREFEAKVVGKDPRSDLAVLQLQNLGDPLPALDLGDSDELEVGDMVLAIGNPFGVGQTVTSGIISALARTTVGITDFRSFIQTDAAVNPGNSGGALITSDGRLVGINTAIYSRDGGSNGIGFAIPSNMVKTVVTSILKDGKAVRAWLGASGKTITADLAKSLSLPRPMGVLIERVTAASPAARGGLQPGDIVRSVNGREVQDLEELRYMIATLPVGGTAQLGLQRDNKEQAIQISLQAPPNTPARQETVLSGQQPFSGATVANLNPALAEELGREYEEPGVIVLNLSGNSIAARLGLRPGDMILGVNETAVKSVADLQRGLGGSVKGWAVTLNRDGQTLKFQVGG